MGHTNKQDTDSYRTPNVFTPFKTTRYNIKDLTTQLT